MVSHSFTEELLSWGSHFTAYSCVLRSSQKWCWCYIHATGLQQIAAEFLAWEGWFSKGVQLIVKMSEERSQKNYYSNRAYRGFFFFFFSCEYLTWGQDLVRLELNFISYWKETNARLLTHNNQIYKAKYINHCQFINLQMSYSDFLFVIQTVFFFTCRYLRKINC